MVSIGYMNKNVLHGAFGIWGQWRLFLSQKTWPLRLIRNYFAYARFCFSEKNIEKKIVQKKNFENF